MTDWSEWRDRRRRKRRRRAGERTKHVCLAQDSEGNLYTEHVFATDGDPWQHAAILTPVVIERLRAAHELPLFEIETECNR